MVTGLFETLIRPYPTAEVTSQGDEVAPAYAGLTPASIEAIWSAVQRLYRSGLHPAISLCLMRRGQVVLERAVGHLRGNGPGESGGTVVRARPDSLFCIFSASKAVTAMLVHLLDERGQLHLDDPVAEYLPEFAANGKSWITIRHVLTHRAGIPSLPTERVDLDILTDWDGIIEALCDATPIWPPGRRLAYHALTGGYVLGEVIRRVSGRDVKQLFADEVAGPLGLRDMSFGVEPRRRARVAENVYTGPPILFPLSTVLRRALGVDFREAAELSNDPRWLDAIVPAGNVYGTARDLCRFFELLRCGGRLGDVEVFERRTIRRAIAEQTYLELDLTLAFPVRYGMGFILGAEHVSLYGPGSAQAFGHLGFTNVVCWADPERAVSGCLMTSGKPFLSPRLWRFYDVMRQIARHCPKEV